MKAIEEKTFPEIGPLVGLSPDQARSKWNDARGRIQKRLADLCGADLQGATLNRVDSNFAGNLTGDPRADRSLALTPSGMDLSGADLSNAKLHDAPPQARANRQADCSRS